MNNNNHRTEEDAELSEELWHGKHPTTAQRPNSALPKKQSLNSSVQIEANFKVKQLKSQLYYMLTENDNLKDELHTLRLSTKTRSTQSSDSRLLTEL